MQNGTFSHHQGFIRRRRLKPVKEGNYVSIVELGNREVFNQMHSSPDRYVDSERVRPLFDGIPTPVVSGLRMAASVKVLVEKVEQGKMGKRGKNHEQW